MNWISTSLSLLLLLQGTTPQQQQRQPSPAATPQQTVRPEDRGSIQGFVVKLGTGEPVAKAVVTVSLFNGGRNQSYSATTTSGGQFAFQNLEPGQYRLSATRNGYVRSEYGARGPNRPGLPVTLAPAQRLNQLVLQIMPAGTITGRVFDRDGEPLANVEVQALRYSYQEGDRVLNNVQSARTNDLGEYRLFWLQPGQYYVSATPPQGQRGALLAVAAAIAGPGIGGAIGDIIAARGGRGQAGGGGRGGRGASPVPPPQAPNTAGGQQAQQEEAYIPVYYPGTTDAQSAAPINLSSGVVFSGVDLTVASTRTLRVTGQVIHGVTGQPVRNANIVLVPGRAGFRGGIRNAGNFRVRNINDQGAFEISGVVPGSYNLIGIINDRNNRMSARVALEIGNSDVHNVSLIISPGFALTGRIAVEGQQGGTGNQDLPRMRVMVRPDSPAQIAGAPPAAPVQADGTFTLQQVGRDDYRLTVTGMPRNGYVKAARLGGTDVLNEGLRLDQQPGGPLEILVSTNTGIADGVVQNERQEPFANVMVVFVPDPARRNRLDLYRTTSTNALGNFHVEGLPPGDYKVFAWEDVETGAWQNPDFLRQFEDRGKPVRINEGGTANIELRAIPPPV
jgi:hypothetical protein